MDIKMKLNIKNRIDYNEIDRLIDRYYDGLTSVDEEKRLHSFLAQKGLPERYKPEQAIFGYFEAKKLKPTFSIQSYIRWMGAVAAVAILVVGIQIFKSGSTADYAYVNGIKITNLNVIKSKALASLSNMSADNDEVEQSFDNLKDKEIMKEQLGVFSESGE
jgi:hypothetical protein